MRSSDPVRRVLTRQGATSQELLLLLVAVAAVGVSGMASIGAGMRASIEDSAAGGDGARRPPTRLPATTGTARAHGASASHGAGLGIQAALGGEVARFMRGVAETVENFDELGPALERSRPRTTLSDLRRVLGESEYVAATDEIWNSIRSGEIDPVDAKTWVRHESDVWIQRAAEDAAARPTAGVLLDDAPPVRSSLDELDEVVENAALDPEFPWLAYDEDSLFGDSLLLLSDFLDTMYVEHDLFRDLEESLRTLIFADLSHLPEVGSYRTVLHGNHSMLLNPRGLSEGGAGELWRGFEHGLIEDSLADARQAFLDDGEAIPDALQSADAVRRRLDETTKDWPSDADAWTGRRLTTTVDDARESLAEFLANAGHYDEATSVHAGRAPLDVRRVSFREALFGADRSALEQMVSFPRSIPDWEHGRLYIDSDALFSAQDEAIARMVRRLSGE